VRVIFRVWYFVHVPDILGAIVRVSDRFIYKYVYIHAYIDWANPILHQSLLYILPIYIYMDTHIYINI